MYLIDTNVISELRKGSRAHPSVVQWNAQIPLHIQWISSISLFELELGVERIKTRDPEQWRHLRYWLDHQVIPAFQGRIISFDHEIAQICARLHIPNPQPERDAMIGATALHKSLTVVTRNEADFLPMGCEVLNPWGSSASV